MQSKMKTYFDDLDSYLIGYIVRRSKSYYLGALVLHLIDEVESARGFKGIKYLLEKHRTIDAICLAAKYDYTDVLFKELTILSIMRKVPSSLPRISVLIPDEDEIDDVVVEISARYGHLETLKELIGENTSLNKSVLIEAMKGDRIDIIEYLIENEFVDTENVSIPGNIRLETLEYVLSKLEVDVDDVMISAIEEDNVENLTYLVERYGFIPENKENLLKECIVSCGDRKFLSFKYLFNKNGTVDVYHLFQFAVSYDCANILSYILANADIEDYENYILDNDEIYTPNIISMVIDRNPRINLWSYGTTAVKYGRLNIIEILMDGRLRDIEDWIEEWLDVAVSEGKRNIVEYLLDEGHGNLSSLIHSAAEENDLDMIEYLVSRMSEEDIIVLCELEYDVPSKRIERYLRSLVN